MHGLDSGLWRDPMEVVRLSNYAILAGVACSDSPVAPASPSVVATSGGGGGGPTATIVIAILGGGGTEAFRPSPVTFVPGVPIEWLNSDTENHRVVATDGSFDTGELEPDAASAPITLTTDGASYFCALHPGEVGVIRSVIRSLPPCSGTNCQ
jgi:plastocyanin